MKKGRDGFYNSTAVMFTTKVQRSRLTQTQFEYKNCKHWRVCSSSQVGFNNFFWINLYRLYPVDSAVGFPNAYPLDNELSGG